VRSIKNVVCINASSRLPMWFIVGDLGSILNANLSFSFWQIADRRECYSSKLFHRQEILRAMESALAFGGNAAAVESDRRARAQCSIMQNSQ
jgi:hypothetical protein